MFRAQVRENLYLQVLEERHVADVFLLVDRDREYLREWLPWVDATVTEDDTLSFVRSSLEQFAAQKGFVAGIWEADCFCGVVGTHKLDLLNQKGEIGYWLGRDFRGKGIMTAAARAVTHHLLNGMGMNRVELGCAAGNTKSCAVAERLGFREEGIAREGILLGGRFHDLRRFAMLKKDWKPEPVGL